MEGTLILLPAHWIFFEASHQQTKLKLRYSCRSITAFLNVMLLTVCVYVWFAWNRSVPGPSHDDNWAGIISRRAARVFSDIRGVLDAWTRHPHHLHQRHVQPVHKTLRGRRRSTAWKDPENGPSQSSRQAVRIVFCAAQCTQYTVLMMKTCVPGGNGLFNCADSGWTHTLLLASYCFSQVTHYPVGFSFLGTWLGALMCVLHASSSNFALNLLHKMAAAFCDRVFFFISFLSSPVLFLFSFFCFFLLILTWVLLSAFFSFLLQ